jgi:mannose-6-phosphate isomerase-like protein (cupin superfamily)
LSFRRLQPDSPAAWRKFLPAVRQLRHAKRAGKILSMPTRIDGPKVVAAAGNKPKRIEEYIGRQASGQSNLSVARMKSPSGWVEPGQRPEFEEYTLVLRGTLRVEFEGGALDVAAGQAVITHPGEWVRYSTPGPEGAEYIAVCSPAFSPDTVHRDPE